MNLTKRVQREAQCGEEEEEGEVTRVAAKVGVTRVDKGWNYTGDYWTSGECFTGIEKER